jgi:hypothetical protein
MLKQAYENGVRAALEKYAQESIQDRYARSGVGRFPNPEVERWAHQTTDTPEEGAALRERLRAAALTPDQLAWMVRTEPGAPVSLPEHWSDEDYARFQWLATPEYDEEQWTEPLPQASWSTGGLPSGGG